MAYDLLVEMVHINPTMETVDVALEGDVAARWTAYVRVRNLLDEDYEELAGFTSPGVAGVAGVRVRR